MVKAHNTFGGASGGERSGDAQEVEFEDKSRSYFQAPGGQVFRVAPMEGGL